MDEELKPCPFCGGQTYRSDNTVFCVGCPAEMHDPDGDMLPLIAAWNRRADGWIPVTGYAPGGALPDDGVKVLVCTDEDEIVTSYFSALAPGRWAVRKGTVIYWQPLPAAPKAGER